MSIPRPEYPRPQFVRKEWLCLNGTWQFEIDAADTGLERGLLARPLGGEITVPFCPESKLSGVHHTDFMEAVWYRREVSVPSNWEGQRVLLHFQAVDYDCTVWVNGAEVGRHRGGFTPFSMRIDTVAPAGTAAVVVVRARDDHRSAKPRGKQSPEYANHGCVYDRTTGIWQSVWLEPVPATAFERPRITPDPAHRMFRLELPLDGPGAGLTVEAVLTDPAGEVARARVAADGGFQPHLDLVVPEDRLTLWEPGAAFLYDIALTLSDASGRVVDRAQTYAGMRSIAIDGKAVRINGKAVFQRQVLDQGYYPDGIMTAPDDAALMRDIELAMAAGFNAARLHQKVFEERFLYHADRLGYLVWGEFGDWGARDRLDRVDAHRHQPAAALMAQWQEVLRRDYNHPCIVGWCPLNETRQRIEDHLTSLDDLTLGLFQATKAADATRPVLDASGYSHRVRGTDVYDSHDYEQDVAVFRANHAGLAQGVPFVNTGAQGREAWSLPYEGQPYFVSEFGGIWWNPEAGERDHSWGYGQRPKDIAEFYARFEGLCSALLDNPGMFTYCYTQLTDVYQEQNGIYAFDRGVKFDLERLRAIQQRPAAIEG